MRDIYLYITEVSSQSLIYGIACPGQASVGRSSAGSLDSNMEGSIISSPHMPESHLDHDCPSRPHQTIPNSSSLLGTLLAVSWEAVLPGPPVPGPLLLLLLLLLCSLSTPSAPHPTSLHHTGL
ncbi:hypothetical protein AOXY_G23602 [Acipenser oxyrinchus oxyrinchus]|uniref:Uncharacterized protein n=1 Tax=Acipenser oxyrinchus oxyrinchus TaxID=40147 RepID=A0AAD8CXN4_ACIOX|nr:hypothetical protein AOXY_G23602 [Acipenser oxyrinchus oxyrinchus]